MNDNPERTRLSLPSVLVVSAKMVAIRARPSQRMKIRRGRLTEQSRPLPQVLLYVRLRGDEDSEANSEQPQ